MSLTKTFNSRHRHERGAVAIIVAITVSALLIAGAIVLDFGLVRYDRQNNKSAADSAVAAGLQAADNGDGEIYNSNAVCDAYQFLKSNRRALAGLPADVCASPNTTQTCKPGDPSTNVSYHGTATSGSTRFEVWIKMPYLVSDTSTGGAFTAESKTTLASDTGDAAQQGCDQLGVVIREWTKPGLGKIVHSGELSTRIRSVARVKVQNGDLPPALLMLERTKCGVLTVGSAGSPSRIAVAGSVSTPATVHSDSDASDSGCGSGSNQQLLQGKQADGIVAYGAGGRPGTITSVATQNGKASNIVLDDPANVYATTSVYPAVGGTSSTVTGRKRVTRRPVDKRYLSGVTDAVTSARGQWLLSHSSPSGYTTRVGCPSGGPSGMATYMAPLAGMTATQSLYIDCPQNSGLTLNGSIGAGTIYFHAFISGGNLAMPNATKVYIDNTDNSDARIGTSSPALTLGNGTAFCVRATLANCNPSTPLVGQCLTAPTGSTSAQALLMVRRGDINSSGGSSPGLLRLCNTTAILEGGQLGAGTVTSPGGCLPAPAAATDPVATSWGTAPTSTPCVGASTSAGTSPVSLAGRTDWVAPNAYDVIPDAQKSSAWHGGEDLALWTETYGSGSTYKMAGGGNMHVSGVFMTPNAFPFTISGSGVQDLTNAQYIVRSFAVDGGASLKMSVDPNNAVGLPSLYDFRLVR